MVWYSHCLKNFPQFVVIHTIKDCGIINEAEVDVSLEFSCFFYDPTIVSNLISDSFAFSKSSTWISRSSWFTYFWSLAWGILSIILLACEMTEIVQYFEHSLAWRFFGIGMKIDLFQSCGHWWIFQMWWHIECSIFTASSFRIWNSSTGIPLPLLSLLVVMFPKSHLTLHSRMSGSMWVITPSWLSGSWSSFLYSLSVYINLKTY